MTAAELRAALEHCQRELEAARRKIMALEAQVERYRLQARQENRGRR